MGSDLTETFQEVSLPSIMISNKLKKKNKTEFQQAPKPPTCRFYQTLLISHLFLCSETLPRLLAIKYHIHSFMKMNPSSFSLSFGSI